MNESLFFYTLTKAWCDQSFYIRNSNIWIVVSHNGFKNCIFLMIKDEGHLLFAYLPFLYFLWVVCLLTEFHKSQGFFLEVLQL